MKAKSASQQLLAEIDATLRQFMHMPNEHCYTVNTLWIAHTHLRGHEGQFLPQRTGRLYFGSKEAGAGKSQAMELTTIMSHNGVVHINPTQFALVTSINLGLGTNGIDEIDRQFGNKGTAAVGVQTVILGGYKSGAFVTRQRNDELDVQNIHGPVVMAGKNLNRFLTSETFETLRTRSFIIPLERKPKGIHYDKYKSEIHESRLRALSNRLKTWGQRYGLDIVSRDVQETMDRIELDNRDEEIWSILFRIADFVGGDWPQRIELAARAMVLGQYDDNTEPIQSPAEELLMYVRAVFRDNEEFLPTRTILKRIFQATDSAWFTREWRTPMAASKGLASILRNVYGIERHRETIDGEQVWGYSRIDVDEDEVDLDYISIPADEWDWTEVDA